MKKILYVSEIVVVIVLSFHHVRLFAQSYQSTNYNFCALNGTCYNDSNHSDVLLNEEYLPEDIEYYTNQFISSHPNYHFLSPASRQYNCHGFAYSIFQGGEKLKIDWYERLCSFNGTSIKSYIEIPESEVRPGDIATIVDATGTVLLSPHSSIVITEDTLLSKWGYDPLFKHYKYDSWIANMTSLGNASHYTYYRRVINTPDDISGPSIFNGTGTYTFTPDVTPTNCTWSIEPAAMFQVSSGTGYTANLSYKTPFEYLAPKATITFTFSYGCDNHYTVSKEFDLRIPTTTISGNAISEGFILDNNATVTVTGNIKSNKNAKTIVPAGTRLILDGGLMTNNDNNFWQGIEVWGNKNVHQYEINGSYGQGYLELKNGAVIENANCAVELWRPNYWGTTGGIIHATDATFRNCAKAVHALYYTNHSYINGSETAYNSSFKNCNFIIDENYFGNQGQKTIDLQTVSPGIYFYTISYGEYAINGKIVITE